MNPPFGTSLNSNIFDDFVKRACEWTCGPVFLFHKKSVENHLTKLCNILEREVIILKEYDYEIERTEFDKKDMKKWKNKKYKNIKPKTNNYHTEDSVTIACCLYRLNKK